MNVHWAACTHLHYEPGGEESGKTPGTHMYMYNCNQCHTGCCTYIQCHIYIDYKLLQDKMSVSITDVPLNGFVPHTVPFNMVLLEL